MSSFQEEEHEGYPGGTSDFSTIIRQGARIIRRQLSSSSSCSQPAHLFTKELNTDCSPGTNTAVAGWGQWKKDPMSLVNTYVIFCQGRKDVFCITAVKAGLWEVLVQCDVSEQEPVAVTTHMAWTKE